MKKNVKTGVRVIEDRIASTEAVLRLSLHVQFDSLAKAERLRQLSRAYQRAFATRKEGRARATLFKFLNTLTTPFYRALPARDMKKVRAFLKRNPR